METIYYPSSDSWGDILKRPTIDSSNLEALVGDILDDVKQNGDKAVRKYSEKFDNAKITSFLVDENEISTAVSLVSPELKNAISVARQNIETFHASQKEETKVVVTMPGVKCWRKSVAIQKVGLYIPGGTAPLFSSILMLAIPAQIAGCSEIVLCTPPSENGEVHPAILYTANLLGINQIFKVGGVQAIGALAFGTETVPKVDKVFGPGNQFVTCAKQLVNKIGVAIDMPAGPSEVLVLADDTAVPAFVAADLLSQAEHGADSQVVLVSTSRKILQKVGEELEKQLELLPRRELAERALSNSKAVLMKSIDEAIELSNFYAPEHLIIAYSDYSQIADQITNAGSIFLGNYTPESAGDYASGTNHTLPTNGFATAYSGVSLDSFVKKITFQEISKEGLANIGETIELMAEAEQLDAHKNAVTIRRKMINKRESER